MNSPGQYVPDMLLEKSGEITPERMKRWNQSERLHNPRETDSFLTEVGFTFLQGIEVLGVSLFKKECSVQVRCTILDAWGWCTGMTQRDGMGREEGGGFRMGNTCIPVADSFGYLAKLIQLCKV